jgi:release factor glutamine methyltransferase
MKLQKALKLTHDLFLLRGISDPWLEAEVILMHTLRMRREELYLRGEEDLPKDVMPSLVENIGQRLNHKPTAYITQNSEFFGIEFQVDERVFIPRPESEILVWEALSFARWLHFPRIADVGTGSGVIALALAMNLPSSLIYATDISASALQVAKINAQRHKVSNIYFLRGDLLSPLPKKLDIIVANLPYVGREDFRALPPEVRFEPREALYGGEDGLSVIWRMFSQIALPPRLLLVEIGMGQAERARKIAQEYFPEAEIDLVCDLAGIERVVKIAC